jgi:hypothetical protein
VRAARRLQFPWRLWIDCGITFPIGVDFGSWPAGDHIVKHLGSFQIEPPIRLGTPDP